MHTCCICFPSLFTVDDYFRIFTVGYYTFYCYTPDNDVGSPSPDTERRNILLAREDYIIDHLK